MTSTEHAREPESGSPRPARSEDARRFQTGVRGLIVVVACGGFMSWAARTLWESQHPAIAAARGLRSAEPAARAAAARQLLALGQADPGRAISPLVAALADSEVEVCIAAVESLGTVLNDAAKTGSVGDPVRAGVDGLIGSLEDREPAVRIAATNALAFLVAVKGLAGVIDVLAAALGDSDDGVRLAALHALTAYGPSASAGPPAAIAAALHDRSARNRSAAITALAAFPGTLDPWLGSLLRSVEHDEPEVRQACQWVLTRSRAPAFSAEVIPELVAALGSRSRIVRAYAARALYLHAIDPRAAVAIPALIALLREPVDAGLVRPPEFGQPIDLDGWDPCELAMFLLVELAPGTGSAGVVVAALAEVVRSGHPSRRTTAIRVLDNFGPAAEPSIPALIRAFREDLARTDECRHFDCQAAARELGQIAPGTKSAEAALEVLIEAADSRRPEAHLETRTAAIGALPAFGAGAVRALPRLRDLRKDPSPRLRAAADRALTAIDGAGSGTASEPEPITGAARGETP
jgi:HEAT repeat protein